MLEHGSAGGEKPLVDMPPGSHGTTLVVDDGAESSSDTSLVTIEPCFDIATRAKRDKVQLTWVEQPDALRYDIYRERRRSLFFLGLRQPSDRGPWAGQSPASVPFHAGERGCHRAALLL